uniref:Putative secreted protein n=1 Tax=Ixodes ricinus TaxID=34613 RepID=A0A6B0UPK6_IXORI
MAVTVQSVVLAGCLLAAVAHRWQHFFGGRRTGPARAAMCAAARMAPQPPQSRYRLKLHCVERFRFPCERRADRSPGKPTPRTEAAAPLLFLRHQSGQAVKGFDGGVSGLLDIKTLSNRRCFT